MFQKAINKVSSTASAGDSPTRRPGIYAATIVGASTPSATMAESVGASAPGATIAAAIVGVTNTVPGATAAETVGASTPSPRATYYC
jgi:hypothetical protein